MTSTPLEAVRQYIDGFNNGDADVMAATFDAQGSILDGMAPHVWVGPTAAEDWYRDALTEGEHLEVSDYLITLGEPSHNDVTGDYAYLVVPANFSYKVRGTPVEQTGAFFTVALHQAREGWRIAAWAWTKGKH